MTNTEIPEEAVDAACLAMNNGVRSSYYRERWEAEVRLILEAALPALRPVLADSEREAVHQDLRAILLALGSGDQARPYSSHEVVQREVLPAITALRSAAARPALAGEVHKPFPDDGVTYCGWATGNGVIEGCGEVWPCSTVRGEKARPALVPPEVYYCPTSGETEQHPGVLEAALPQPAVDREAAMREPVGGPSWPVERERYGSYAPEGA